MSWDILIFVGGLVTLAVAWTDKAPDSEGAKHDRWRLWRRRISFVAGLIVMGGVLLKSSSDAAVSKQQFGQLTGCGSPAIGVPTRAPMAPGDVFVLKLENRGKFPLRDVTVVGWDALQWNLMLESLRGSGSPDKRRKLQTLERVQHIGVLFPDRPAMLDDLTFAMDRRHEMWFDTRTHTFCDTFDQVTHLLRKRDTLEFEWEICVRSATQGHLLRDSSPDFPASTRQDCREEKGFLRE